MRKEFQMVYSKRLYTLLAEHNIYPIKTMINLTNARLKTWQYKNTPEFEEIFKLYVEK